MSRSEIIKYLILRSIGNFLLLFALFGVIATFGPSLYYELYFRIGQIRGVTYSVTSTTAPSATGFGDILKQQELQKSNGFANILSGPTEQILIPKDTDFSLLIPKLGASAKVFPNVGVENEKEFLPILQKGVAHAKGSVFPGIAGNTYLFAHSTDNFWDVGRYNAIFYLLKDLTIGDDITVFFENKRFNYVVSDTKIVDPKDVDYLIKGQNIQEEQLVLQTCWPPGTTWKRLLVIAKKK